MLLGVICVVLFLSPRSGVGPPQRAPLVWLSADNAATVCAYRTLCGRCFRFSGVNTHGTAGARGNWPVALLKVDLEFSKKPQCVPWIASILNISPLSIRWF